MWKGFRMYPLLLALIFVLSGCDSDSVLQQIQGSYQGTERTQGIKANAEAVQARVIVLSPSELELTLVHPGSSIPWRTLKVDFRSRDEIEIRGVPFARDSDLRLTRDSAECFSALAEMRAEFCVRAEGISLDFVDHEGEVTGFSYQLLLKKSSSVIEAPARSYRISELFGSTLLMNVGSRLQYETYVQGKLRARNAYLNLLPHLSGATILGALSGGGVTGALSLIGDLAPFLLPNRWIQAEEAHELAEAQKVGVALVRLDAAQITESLAFEILRDQRFLEILSKNQEEVRSILNEIRFREQVGQLPAGSADEIAGVLNGIERDVLELRETLHESYASLALAVGFNNPAGISGIVDDVPENISHPDQFQEDELKKRALARSLELAQLDWLVRAAQNGVRERLFNWIDPSGDGAGGLGAGLPDYINIGKSVERQLQIQRESLQAQVLDKVSNGLAFHQKTLERYRLAVDELGLQERRVDRHVRNLRLGVSFPLIELASSFKDRAQAELEKTSLETDYRVNLSRIQRLALIGPFDGPASTP